MDFFQSAFFSNILATVALLISISSVCYTFINNRPKIEMTDYDIEYLESENTLLNFSFVFANTSSKTITIREIKLLNSKGEQLQHTFVEPPINEWLKYSNPSFSPYSCSPFTKPEILISNAALEFSYLLDDEPIMIEILTDKRINHFRKKQRFTF